MPADTSQHQKRSRQDAFLGAYSLCGNILRASQAAGINRAAHYDWLQEKGSDYGERFDFAKAEAAELMEAEARRRAVEGVRRLKFNAKTGEPYTDPETGKPYEEHEYSDTLLIFLLKGAKPETYRERVEHSGEVRALVVRDLDTV